MPKRAWAAMCGGVLIGVGAAGYLRWFRHPPVGQASGELQFRGHTGAFSLKPDYCRRGVGLTGAGVYARAAPALAFGYFNDRDGGEWFEAQGPGASATRFDREDCSLFEAKVENTDGLVSGHVELVCDSKASPGVTHAEGQTTFSRCSESTVK